jgi:hypothetical protein
VDLTALIAALRQSKWSGNGVGNVPAGVLVEKENERRKFELSLRNAKAIMEQLRFEEGESRVLDVLDNAS